MKKFYFFICLGFYLQLLNAQFKTAEQIIEAVGKKYELIDDYIANIEAAVDMDRVKVPKMNVKIYFRKPDKFHVESKNFAMIPKEGVTLNPAEILKNFNAQLIGVVEINSRKVYKLKLNPKVIQKQFVPESYVYIDFEYLYLVKLESSQSETRSIDINFQHTFVDNKYYLPEKIILKFENKIPDNLPDNTQRPNQQRIPRAGNVTILYKNYQINSGFPDSVFTQKEKP
ncbi:MAG: hypothetical protein O3A55_02945 [Bacteroidetes bacterium]|nr:hypothetical protein [Bacteroidota bacterium]